MCFAENLYLSKEDIDIIHYIFMHVKNSSKTLKLSPGSNVSSNDNYSLDFFHMA